MTLHRRDAVKSVLALWGLRRMMPQTPMVATLIGTGAAGYSARQVSNPYGLLIGPDNALYFCDLDNQRIRRFDMRTRQSRTVAWAGRRGYAGDGALATAAWLNMPHEIQFDAAGHLCIAERDNHAIRRVHAVHRATGGQRVAGRRNGLRV